MAIPNGPDPDDEFLNGPDSDEEFLNASDRETMEFPGSRVDFNKQSMTESMDVDEENTQFKI